MIRLPVKLLSKVKKEIKELWQCANLDIHVFRIAIVGDRVFYKHRL